MSRGDDSETLSLGRARIQAVSNKVSQKEGFDQTANDIMN